MRVRCGWCVLVSGLAVAACGGDGGPGLDPGPPRTVITAPGDGPENTGPLWPLRAGLSGDDIVVGDPSAVGDYLAFPVTRPGLPNAYDGPRNWTHLASTDDGVVLLGNPRDGLYPRPLLVIPAHVKHGMTWTVDPGDGGVPVSCGAISPFGAQATRTQWGAPGSFVARPWEVGCARDWAFGEAGRNVVFGAKVVEGLGPAGRNARLVPLEDHPAMPEAARPVITLEPLNGGDPLGESFRADRMGAFVNPAHDGSAIRLVIEGEGLAASGDQNGNFNTFNPVGGTICLLLGGTTLTAPPDAAGLDYDGLQRVCPDPLMTSIGPTGTLDSGIGYCVPGTNRCSVFSPLVGIFPGTTSTQGIGVEGLTGTMYIGDLHVPPDPTMPMLDNARVFSPTTIPGPFEVIPDRTTTRRSSRAGSSPR